MILSSAKLPFDDRETHGYRGFAEACGYELSNYEVVRHLALPVPDEQIQEWVDKAAPHHEGYAIETFVDEVPDDLVEDRCACCSASSRSTRRPARSTSRRRR